MEPGAVTTYQRQFHIEVDHDSQGVLLRAITIRMPKPPQAGHQIPSLQLRRDHKREFGTSRGSQDRGPSLSLQASKFFAGAFQKSQRSGARALFRDLTATFDQLALY